MIVEAHKFGFDVSIKTRPPTRRGILSVVGSVFDPFDFVTPFVLPAKKILQDLCRLKLGWDDEIPYEQGLHWQRWLADVPKLSEFTVHRCFIPANFGDISSSQLHHFPIPRKLHLDQFRICAWLITMARFTVPFSRKVTPCAPSTSHGSPPGVICRENFRQIR